MTHDVRNSGIPVLAYHECSQSGGATASSPVSLSLICRFNEPLGRASLLLQAALFIDGHDEKQMIILQYDADNLKHGKNSIGPATIPLPQHRLDQVSRDGNPQIRTLSLTLKKESPVWCPRSLKAVAPRSNHEHAFYQIANLAKATKLDILFDYNWLHRVHHTIFQRLVEHPEQLTGFPVWRHYSKQYRREDWSIFNTAEENATTEDEVNGEGPPVYTENSKRPRHVTPTPSSPLSKRIHLSPHSDIHTSPTEKDSATTPSPRLLHSATPDLQAIEQAVSAILPGLLSTLLPTLLPRLLTTSSPSPAPSLQSMASQLSTAPPPPQLSALGVSLGEHMTRRIETEVQTLYAHTVSHANFLRNTADANFFQDLEDDRLAFERVIEDKYREFEEMVGDAGDVEVERVGERVDELASRAVERAERVEEDRKALEREKAELRRDQDQLRLERRELRADKEFWRRQQMALQREGNTLHDARLTRTANRARSLDTRSIRAGSAPL